MKKLKVLYKMACIGLIFVTILSFNNSGIIKETKATNTNLNKNINLSAMAKVIQNFTLEDKNAILDTYYGTLTGYGADCALCSGYLGCNGQNVKDGTTTYTDDTYGLVNIVASSTSLACGSIVRFTHPQTKNEVTAIVLDRGVTGTALDLLVRSESVANEEVGSQKINYDILRFGWNRKEV